MVYTKKCYLNIMMHHFFKKVIFSFCIRRLNKEEILPFFMMIQFQFFKTFVLNDNWLANEKLFAFVDVQFCIFVSFEDEHNGGAHFKTTCHLSFLKVERLGVFFLEVRLAEVLIEW